MASELFASIYPTKILKRNQNLTVMTNVESARGHTNVEAKTALDILRVQVSIMSRARMRRENQM